jgi:hypothetical protein
MKTISILASWVFLGWMIASAAPCPAGMVDTVQFGRIEKGMKESEVKERLGPPDKVDTKEEHKHTGSRGASRVTHVRKTKFVYEGVNPASGQRITTTILFENGKVVDKKRVTQ